MKRVTSSEHGAGDRATDRSDRRGSALVVAIGSLALIAVLAAVYVTIGQSDLRVAEAVEAEQEVANVETSAAEIISGVVGRDRLAQYFETIPVIEGGGGFGGASGELAFSQRAVREAFDLPFTDAMLASQIDRTSLADPAARARVRFSPEGTMLVPSVTLPDPSSLGGAVLDNDAFDRSNPGAGNGPLVDYRRASDPYLAASEPSFAGFSNDERIYSRPVLASDAMTGRVSEIGPRPRPELFFMDHRDWSQITNIAPDGRFVNLWNLRNNFDAGYGFGGDVADPRGNDISFGLSLLRPVRIEPGEPVDLRLQATRELPIGLTPQRPAQVVSLDSTLADLGYTAGLGDLPADLTLERLPVWTTMRQRFMYFPLDGRFRVFERPADPTDPSADLTFATPDSIDFPDYQYADADGDGMADSRWFEFVDAFDPEAVSHLVGEAGQDVRWFFATRVVDLSGRVNVNTATDQLAAPTGMNPAGMTPAEVDVRRLLSLEDVATSFVHPREVIEPQGGQAREDEANPSGINSRGSLARLSLRDIEQPGPVDDPFAFELPGDHNEGYQVGFADLFVSAGGLTIGGSLPLPSLGTLTARTEDSTPMLLAGRFGYDALRREIEQPAARAAVEALEAPDDYSGGVWPEMRLVGPVGAARPIEFGLIARGQGTLDLTWTPVSTGDNAARSPDRFLSDRSPFLLADAGIEPAGPDTPTFEGVPLYLTPLASEVIDTGGTGRLMFHETPEGPSLARRLSYELLGQIDPLDADTLARLSEANVPAAPLRVPAASQAPFQPRFGAYLFGLEDLAELLTFEGLNSPVTSRLERAVSGRFRSRFDSASGSTTENNTDRLSPLRANRALSLERDTYDNTFEDFFNFPVSPEVYAPTRFGPNDVLDAETMALLALDARRRVTTLSGASMIRSTPRTGPLHLGEHYDRLGVSGLTASGRVEPRRQDRHGVATESTRLARERINPTGGSRNLDDEFDDTAAFMNAGDAGLVGTLLSDPADTGLGISNPDFILADWSAEAAIGVADLDLNRYADTGPAGGTPADDNNLFADAREFDSHPADQGIAFSLPDLFRLYTEALMVGGGLAEGRAWVTGDPEDADERLATLFYGHVGPELSLRLSAHMAVNFRDSYDRDDTPSVATLLVDGRVEGAEPDNNGAFRRDLLDGWLNAVRTGAAEDQRAFPFWSWIDPYTLSPNDVPPGVPPAELRTRLDLDEIRGVVEPLDQDELTDGDAREFAETDWNRDGRYIDTEDDPIREPRWLARDNPQLDNSIVAPNEVGGDAYAPQGAVPNERSAVNVIGIEAQPFITEVAMINVFTDTPRAALYGDLRADLEVLTTPGPVPTTVMNRNAELFAYEATSPAGALALPLSGDVDQIPAENQLGITIELGVSLESPGPTGVTLNALGQPEIPGSPPQSVNPDFVFQAIAFQLHNPFDHAVVLGSGQSSSGDLTYTDFYLEYGGWFFPLGANVSEDSSGLTLEGRAAGNPFIIGPGETVVFYCTGQNLREMADRIDAIQQPYSQGLFSASLTDAEDRIDALETLFQRQFSRDDPTAPIRAFRTVPVDPRTMDVLPAYRNGNGFNLLEPQPIDAPILADRPARAREVDTFVIALSDDTVTIDEVRLWRRHVIDTVDSSGDFIEPATTEDGELWYENDLLVDRFRLVDNETRFPAVDPASTSAPRAPIAFPDADLAHPFRRTAPGTVLRIDNAFPSINSGGVQSFSIITEDFQGLRLNDVGALPLGGLSTGGPEPLYDDLAARPQNNGFVPGFTVVPLYASDTGFTVALWASVRRPDHREATERDDFIELVTENNVFDDSGNFDAALADPFDAFGPFPFFDRFIETPIGGAELVLTEGDFPSGGLPAWVIETPALDTLGLFTNITQDATHGVWNDPDGDGIVTANTQLFDPDNETPLGLLEVWETGFWEAGDLLGSRLRSGALPVPGGGLTPVESGVNNTQVHWSLNEALSRWADDDSDRDGDSFTAGDLLGPADLESRIVRTLVVEPQQKALRIFEWMGFDVEPALGEFDGNARSQYDAALEDDVRVALGEVAIGFAHRSPTASGAVWDEGRSARNPYTEITPPDAWSPRNAADQYLDEAIAQLYVGNSRRVIDLSQPTRPQRDTSANRADENDAFRRFGTVRDAAGNDGTIADVDEEDPVSRLRVMDLLNVLAVGPVHAPLRDELFASSFNTDENARAAAVNIAVREYITLGEALATALGFNQRVSRVVYGEPIDINGDIASFKRATMAVDDPTQIGFERTGAPFEVPDLELFATPLELFAIESPYAQTGALVPFGGNSSVGNPRLRIRSPRAEASSRVNFGRFVDAGVPGWSGGSNADNNPPPGDPTHYTPYNELVVPSPEQPAETLFRLDRGQLRLDAFAAFFNQNPRQDFGGETLGGFDADGGLDAGEANFLASDAGNPGNNTALAPSVLYDPEEGDFVVGFGAPMTGNIFNIARGLGVPLDLDADSSRSGVDRLNRIARGRVNLNTVSSHAARVLPGLTPPMFASLDEQPDMTRSLTRDFWATRENAIEIERRRLGTLTLGGVDELGFNIGRDVPNLDGPAQNIFGLENPVFPFLADRPSGTSTADRSQFTNWRRNPDRAAMVLAYRDRQAAAFRSPSQPRFLDLPYNTADRLRLESAEVDQASFAPIFSPYEATTDPAATDFESRVDAATVLNLASLVQRNFEARPEALLNSAGGVDNVDGLTDIDPEFLGDRGRSLLSGIPGLRPQPGFASFAELLGVTVDFDGDPGLEVLGQTGETFDDANGISAIARRFDVGNASVAQGLGEVFIDPNDTVRTRRWEGEYEPDANNFSRLLLPLPDERNGLDFSDAPRLLGPHTLLWPGHDLFYDAENAEYLDRRIGLGSLRIDPTAAEVMTIEPSLTRNDPDTEGRTADGIANEYDEQLAVLGQLHNVVDVRSDVFAAWFLVRGYREQDVDVGPEEPMIPFVERRFLMIIDRSNVTSIDDQPQIVLFRELSTE